MYRYIVFAVFLFLLFSCKKTEQTEQNHQNPCDNATDCSYTSIDTSMKGFFFLPNSYWIYKRDSLNIYDSVVLQSIQIGCEILPQPLSRCLRAEYYIMNYKRFPSNEQYYDCIEGSILMRNYHPLDAHWYYGWMLYNTEGGPTLDSLKVGELTFYKVQGYYRGYCAKNIGLVKISSGSNAYNLIRWKICK